MQVQGRYSPHPRGFGFVDFEAQVELISADGNVVTADSGFVPPPLAAGWLADDKVVATVELDDRQRVNVTALELKARPRRFLVGKVATFAGTTSIVPDVRLGSGRIPLAGPLADKLVRVDDRQVVVIVTNDQDGQAVAQSLVAGPTPVGAPAAIRARAVTIAHGGVVPDTIEPGPEAIGLSSAEATGTALRSLGRLAAGSPGLAAGLDVAGPIPGVELVAQDRRGEVVVTIDDDRSKDLDDALAARWEGVQAEPVEITVHIADAAGVVGMGSPADRHVLVMATSTYLAVGGVAPMLGPELSEDLLSLLPGKDRGVLSVDCTVAPDGALHDVTLSRSAINVTARLSYAAVDAFLDGHDPQDLGQGAHGTYGAAKPELAAVASTMTALAEAARRLGVQRDTRNMLDVLFLPAEFEAAIVDGKIRAIPADPHPDAQRLVERLMVAANEVVAGWAMDHQVPLLYRTHMGFDPDRLAGVVAAATAAGVELPQPPRPADVLLAVEELRARDATADADLLATAAAGAVARATIASHPSGHEGLDAVAYTQFTSPIRRCLDLVVHRQIRATLAGEQPPYDQQRLDALAPWLDVRSGAASHVQALERSALWSVLLERGALPWPAQAVVTRLTPAGAMVRIPAAGVGGFIAASHLTDARGLQVADDATATADGTIRLGQRIQVRLDRIDPAGRPDLKPA